MTFLVAVALIIVTVKASPNGKGAAGPCSNSTAADCSVFYINSTSCGPRREFCLGRRNPRLFPGPACKIDRRASSDFDYFFTRIALDLEHPITYDLELENCAYQYQVREVRQPGVGLIPWQYQCNKPSGKMVKAEFFQYVGNSNFFNVYRFAEKARKYWFFTRIFKKAYGSSRVGCSLRMTCEVFEAACFFAYFKI